MSKADREYHKFLTHILLNGQVRPDRTGVGTIGVFGYQMRFDLSEGLPLITTKRLHYKSILGELLWMLKGDGNVTWLQDNGISIWDEWADENGDLGPIYGVQWRSWETSEIDEKTGNLLPAYVDQIANLVTSLKNDPFSRRHIVSAWNPGEIDLMALPPCHAFFQFYVSADFKLSCHLYQRSGDAFLGIPFNIASYATLTQILAKVCGYEVGEFVHTIGDAHIYSNHLPQVQEQLSRDGYKAPHLEILASYDDLAEYELKDFILHNYVSDKSIPAKVAV